MGAWTVFNADVRRVGARDSEGPSGRRRPNKARPHGGRGRGAKGHKVGHRGFDIAGSARPPQRRRSVATADDGRERQVRGPLWKRETGCEGPWPGGSQSTSIVHELGHFPLYFALRGSPQIGVSRGFAFHGLYRPFWGPMSTSCIGVAVWVGTDVRHRPGGRALGCHEGWLMPREGAGGGAGVQMMCVLDTSH